MLDDAIVAVTRDLLEGVVASRERGLEQNLLAKQSELARRGMLDSSVAIQLYADAAADELRFVAETLWAALLKSMAAMPPKFDPNLKNDVMAAFGTLFREKFGSIDAAMTARIRPGAPAMTAHGTAMIQGKYEALLRQYKGEITLWASARERSRSAAAPTPAATYNFHGPIGSLQTGPGAMAHVVQNIGPGDVAGVVEQLRELARQIGELQSIDERERGEGVTLATDIQAELQTAQPSRVKLRGLFYGLSEFVQALGAAPSAYVTLQSMASAIGLM
jgi:hypothetical protein